MYLTVKQVAELTGYNDKYIYELVRKEKIPFVKMRGRLRFEKDKIEQWMMSPIQKKGE